MNNNEIWESIKKAFKVTLEKLDNHYMFYLDEMAVSYTHLTLPTSYAV